MKQVAVVAVMLLAGCAYTPDHRQADPGRRADPGSVPENLVREGSSPRLSSTQNAFQTAGCYVQAVLNRGDGLTAAFAKIEGEDRWRVAVRETRRPDYPIAIVDVVPAGTGSTAELYMRGRGGIEGFKRFLAERC
jgi:hypothetical protein